jgi:hypothetical protein
LLGGAAGGAAMAYFVSARSGAANRARDIPHETRESVGRVPLALRKPTDAASTALSEAIAAEDYNRE